MAKKILEAKNKSFLGNTFCKSTQATFMGNANHRGKKNTIVERDEHDKKKKN